MIASLVISFFMVFIVPTIEKMFADFGISLPAPMVWFIAIGQYFPWLIIPGVVLYLASLLIRPLLISRDAWPFGLEHRMLQAGSQLLDLLAMIVQSKRPVSAGIATLSRVHPIGSIRRRLVQASRSIQQGENEWQALADVNLLSSANQHALQLTDDRWTQAWLLHRSANARSMAANLQSAFMVRSLSLLTLLVLAAIVMLAAVGMFMSIYGLVEAMAHAENIG